MKNIIIKDNYTNELLAILLVNDTTNIEDIENDIKKTKEEFSGDWQLSNIIEGISVKYQEFEFESVYV